MNPLLKRSDMAYGITQGVDSYTNVGTLFTVVPVIMLVLFTAGQWL